MKRAVFLLGLGLTTLSACQAKGAPMNLLYVVTALEGGIAERLTVKGRQAEFFTFSFPESKGFRGTFSLSNSDAATLTRLSAGLKDYECQPSNAADNQTIEISVQGVQIRCSEASMHENRAVDQLIQVIRRLIGSQLTR
jgi:hypothetical protein